VSTVVIEEGRLDDVLEMLRILPEFEMAPSGEEITSRISGVPHLVLTAHDGNNAAGFKIGYEREGTFYSWLGGVLPEYRRKGVATLLADAQEKWAGEQGYTSIWMKTRNRFPAMLIMALGRGFRITGFDPRGEIGEHRIVLTKSL
jgi:GNAT superfamily N-acetyltransferase